MNKREFLSELEQRLSGLPGEELRERLTFYGEMIDDRMEDGIPEEIAVGELGGIDEAAAQIVADIPLGKLVKEKLAPKKKLKAWEIALLALGAPIWLSLLIAAFAVILSFYAALWSVIAALWAVFASLVTCASLCVALGFSYAVKGDTLSGFALIGAGAVCAGLSIFLFFGCKAAAKGILTFTKKSAIRMKNRFLKKENVK